MISTLPKNNAFTLVEVMISVTIVTLIASVVLFNYTKFSDNLALSAAGQEMVINVRQAQTYGLAVKEVTSGGGKFDFAYGIYFNKNTDPKRYYLFVDKNNGATPPNQKYDVGSGCGNTPTECVGEFTIRDGVTINTFCDGSVCPPFGNASINAMNITFLRPNPDARINFVDSGGTVVGTASQGQIVLTSPKGKNLTITVQNTGQISVQ